MYTFMIKLVKIDEYYKLFVQKTDIISVINEENGKIMDFTIATSCVNMIPMCKIETYLKQGSSSNPPGEAFQALDIVLKNRPFSLRLIKQ